MAIIAIPDHHFRTVDWTLRQPTQVNRSEWTGRRQVMQMPGAALWLVQAEHVPIIGEDNIRPWRAFLAAMRGQVNVTRVKATGLDQRAGAEPVIVVGAAGASTIGLAGMAPSAVLLPAGAMMTVIFTSGASQLVVLRSDLVADSDGNGIAQFDPMLRASAVGGVVETIRPWCQIALDTDTSTISIDRGWQYSVSLAGTEAI